MAKLRLCAPWQEHYEMIKAMFAEDPDVFVLMDEEQYEIRIYVYGQAKADALELLLIHEVAYGNITLKVTVIPADQAPEKEAAPSVATLFKAAFDGNCALSYVKTLDGPFKFNATYVVFAKEVVQYYRDDLSDIHGLRSTLYEDLARDIFVKTPGVYFCTDDEEIETLTISSDCFEP